jgi:hypothetical protein
MIFIEVLITVTVLTVAAGFFGTAGRTALALLVSPSLYFLLTTWPRCSAAAAFESCLEGFVIFPLAVLFEPIGLDDAPPPNPFPGILLIALTIVVAWTMIAFAINRYKRSRASG